MKDSICALLHGRYPHQVFRNSAHEECPECHHHCLSIYANDTRAHCHYSSCGFWASTDQHSASQVSNPIAQMWAIHNACITNFTRAAARRLLEVAACDGKAPDKFIYDGRAVDPAPTDQELAIVHLLKRRGINITQSMFAGASPEEWEPPYGLSCWTETQVDYYLTQLVQVRDHHQQQGTWSADCDAAYRLLHHYGENSKPEGALSKFRQQVLPNRLCYFHRDPQTGQLRAIKWRHKEFQPPNSKFLFQTWKNVDLDGTMRDGFFFPLPLDLGKPIYAFEGELNGLAFHAAYPDSQWLCIGGAKNNALEDLDALPYRKLYFCPDSDRAGAEVVERLRGMFVWEIPDEQALPHAGTSKPKDYCDLVHSWHTTGKNPTSMTEQLLRTAIFHAKPVDEVKASLRQECARAKEAKDQGDAAIQDGFHTVIMREMRKRGAFYRTCHDVNSLKPDEKHSLLFHAYAEDNIEELNWRSFRDSELRRWLYLVGLEQEGHEYKRVLNAILVGGHCEATTVRLYDFTAYDPLKNALYIAVQRQSRIEVCRITNNEIAFVPNGTDGFLFRRKCLDDFQYQPVPDKAFTMAWLLGNMNIDHGNGNANHQRLILLAWLLELFLPDRNEHFVPVLYGERGTGKTSGIRWLLRGVFGKSFQVEPLPEDREDAERYIATRPLCVFDDVNRRCRYLKEFINRAATGSQAQTRKLYTDDVVLNWEQRPFILTTNDPHFMFDDTQSRLLVFRTEPFQAGQAFDENSVSRAIAQHRDSIVSDFLRILQRGITVMADESETPQCEARFKGSVAFAYKLFSNAQWVIDCFDALAREASKVSIESDPLADQIEAILMPVGESRSASQLYQSWRASTNNHNEKRVGNEGAFARVLSGVVKRWQTIDGKPKLKQVRTEHTRLWKRVA